MEGIDKIFPCIHTGWYVIKSARDMNSLYLILKTLHILGSILFLGNIIITAWWKLMADRRSDAVVVAFAQRQITLTDYVFTAGGAALLAIGGLGLAYWYGIGFWHTPWLSWGLSLFIASGVIWVAILVPVQTKQARLARSLANGGPIPVTYREELMSREAGRRERSEYWRLGRIWNGFGLLATLLPLIAVYLMVFKPV